jgi:putative ABC transport system ATP-binding protein
VLELRRLVKHYLAGDGQLIQAVDGVSLSVAAGEFVAFYGPSGSGKTTLLKLIATILRPDTGSVLVDGREISSLSDAECSHYRLHDLGMVDQSFDLLPGANVLQNAAIKLWLTESPRIAERRVQPLLERLGLAPRLLNLPHELSMGERQRVVIARALSTDPKLVLADEPTGNLDTHRSREVLDLLGELCRERGAAVLLATHDPQATDFAHRAYTLSDGRIVEHQQDQVRASLSARPIDRQS